MLKKKFRHWSTIFLLSCSLLAGCGGDDSSDGSDSGAEVVAIVAPTANEALNQVTVSSTADGKAVIDLSQAVMDPQGLPLLLASVEALDTGSACSKAVINKTGLSYTIDSRSVDVCYYKYTVQNIPQDQQQGLSASSTSTVVVSEYILSGKLPLIGVKTDIETDIDIDLKAKLAGSFPVGYHLDDDLLIMGDGTGTADRAANIITYSPVAVGFTRVMYSLVSESGADAKAGAIDISVSATADTMPSAKSFELKTDISPSVKVTIDVTNPNYCGGVSCISDPDGDTLQLTDVYAYNAQVEPTPQTNLAETLGNTSFDFSAKLPGTYDVSYYVSDHNAGFAVGVVRINVVDSSPTDKPWYDIILSSNNERYTAPWEQTQADQIGLPYQQLYQEINNSGSYSIPLFSWLTADALCKTRGMVLPSPNQAKKLYNEITGGISFSKNWPVQRTYWTSKLIGGSEASEFDFLTGKLATASKNKATIVTCVAVGELSGLVTTKNNAFILPGGDYDSVKATVTHTDGSPLDGQTLFFYSDAQDSALDYNKHVGSSDNQGQVSVDITSTEPGDYWVYANYLTQTKKTKITFLDNPLTSIYFDPTSLTMKRNKQKSVKVKAKYLSGTIVDITDDAKLTSDNHSVATGTTGSVNSHETGVTYIRTSYTDRGHNEVAALLVTVQRSSNGLSVESDTTLDVYEEKQLHAYVNYDDGTRKDVTSVAKWSSNDDAVTVFLGKVRGEYEGHASVKAEAEGQNGSASVTVNSATPPPPIPDGLSVTPPSTSVGVGETAVLMARLHYDNGTSLDVTSTAKWVSNNAHVTVGTGIVFGVSSGESRVTATAGGYADTADITVTTVTPPPVEPDGFRVSPSQVDLTVGKATQIRAFLHYPNGDEKDVTGSALWKTDSDVVMLSTGAVSGLKPGVALVTASSSGYDATARVVVTAESQLATWPEATAACAGRGGLPRLTWDYSTPTWYGQWTTIVGDTFAEGTNAAVGPGYWPQRPLESDGRVLLFGNREFQQNQFVGVHEGQLWMYREVGVNLTTDRRHYVCMAELKAL